MSFVCTSLTTSKESTSNLIGSSVLLRVEDKPSIQAHSSASKASQHLYKVRHAEKMIAPLESLKTIPAPALPSTVKEPLEFNLTFPALGGHQDGTTSVDKTGDFGIRTT